MEKSIVDFIACKNIALIGMSRTKNKFGNYAYKELTSRGYNVYPIHPNEKEINGIQCSGSIESLKDKVEWVFISVKQENVLPIIQEISATGIKNVWLQQGCETKNIVEQAEMLGLNLASKKCILMYAEPVKSIHKFHRVLSDIFVHS